MIKTINHSWAIPESMINRHGEIWAGIDFEINPRISNYAFRNDPLSVNVGKLCLCNKKLDTNLKQLRSLKTILEHVITDFKLLHGNQGTIDVNVLNITFHLRSIEIQRLYETITDSIDVIQKSYRLGLYL